MFGKDSGDVLIVCPYDKTHRIQAKGFNAHLVRCRESHPDHRIAVCKFDQTHRVPKPELPHHHSECPSRYLLDREMQLKASGNNMLAGDVKGPPIVSQHVDETEEDWDSAPAYSASFALFNKRRARNEEAEEGAAGPYIPPVANNATGPSRAATQPSSSPNDSEGTFRRMPLAPSRAAQMSAEVRPQPGSGSEVYSYSVGSKSTAGGSGYGRGRGRGLRQAPPNVGIVHPFSYPTSNISGPSPSSSAVNGMESPRPGGRGGANFAPGGPYSQVPGFPGQMPGFPGQMHFPGQMPDFQSQMPWFTNQSQQFTGEMQSFPSQVQHFPGQLQHFPGQNPGFSDHVPGFPGQVPRSELSLQPPRIPQVNSSSGGASDWNRSVQYEDSFSTMPNGQLQQQETLQREDLLQQRYQLGQQQHHLQQLQHQQQHELDMQKLQQTFTPLTQGRGHRMTTISSQNNIVPGTAPETRPLPVGRGTSHDLGRLRTPASSSRAQAIQEQKDIQSGIPVTEIQKDHAENEDDEYEQWCDYDTATYASALQASRPHNDSPAAVADPGNSKPADTGNEGSVMDMVSSWLDQQKLDDTRENDSKYSGKDFSQLSKEDLQKTKRRLEKKLKQIAVLEQKVTAGEKLSPEEESKLQKKRDIVLELDKIATLL